MMKSIPKTLLLVLITINITTFFWLWRGALVANDQNPLQESTGQVTPLKAQPLLDRIASANSSSSATETTQTSSPPLANNNTVAPKTPHVAICMVGGLRTFALASLREAFVRNFLSAFDDPLLLIDIPTGSNCGSNALSSDTSHCRKMESAAEKLDMKQWALDAGIKRVHVQKISDLNCDHSYLKDRACCRPSVRKYGANSMAGWNGYFAYERKRHCLDWALEIQDSSQPFDYFVVIRPDLYFLEPLPPLFDQKVQRTPRIFASSKEMGQPPGDYLYVIPRTLVQRFSSTIEEAFTDHCNGNNVPWPPEYVLENRFNRIPFQMMPFPFVIVRENGDADCFRLNTEVFAKSRPVDPSGQGEQAITMYDYCAQLKDSGKFQSPA